MNLEDCKYMKYKICVPLLLLTVTTGVSCDPNSDLAAPDNKSGRSNTPNSSLGEGFDDNFRDISPSALRQEMLEIITVYMTQGLRWLHGWSQDSLLISEYEIEDFSLCSGNDCPAEARRIAADIMSVLMDTEYFDRQNETSLIYRYKEHSVPGVDPFILEVEYRSPGEGEVDIEMRTNSSTDELNVAARGVFSATEARVVGDWSALADYINMTTILPDNYDSVSADGTFEVQASLLKEDGFSVKALFSALSLGLSTVAGEGRLTSIGTQEIDARSLPGTANVTGKFFGFTGQAPYDALETDSENCAANCLHAPDTLIAVTSSPITTNLSIDTEARIATATITPAESSLAQATVGGDMFVDAVLSAVSAQLQITPQSEHLAKVGSDVTGSLLAGIPRLISADDLPREWREVVTITGTLTAGLGTIEIDPPKDALNRRLLSRMDTQAVLTATDGSGVTVTKGQCVYILPRDLETGGFLGPVGVGACPN